MLLVLLGAAHKGALGKLAGLLAVGLLGALIATPSASGQAAVDQYQQPPVPGGGTAGQVAGGGAGSQNAGDAGGAVAGETGSGSGSGALPFTGYPLTPFVLIALALLCAGVLFRLVVPAIRRIRA
jgi:hypothetical protein